MAGRTYERLSIEVFGEHLLRTNDLDPVYVALEKCLSEYQWPVDQIGRWLVAYWCFYHAGVASWMSELDDPVDYWHWMHAAAQNELETPVGTRWPRAHERRHFRGEQAKRAMAELSKRYETGAHKMVDYVVGPYDGSLICSIPFADVSRRVREHRGFGPWIAFKVGDMIDRIGLGPSVDFDQAEVFMFKDPKEAALRLWRLKAKLPNDARPKTKEVESVVIGAVVEHLEEHFIHHRAPPLYDRPVGLQEVETILCKWKSHMNGHYPLFNDIDDITKGLDLWASESGAAAAFMTAMPKTEAVH